ncbi:ribonuclease H-like domain-containing protein, partial [Tanacetum coccineum]
TQKTLLKQMYENFNASSSESLDSIFTKLQKIVSHLRNKPDMGSISFDDLYNNCHKMGHFGRECRNPKSQENRSRNQDSSRRTMNVEESSSKAMLAIDGAGFDWNFMTEEEC